MGGALLDILNVLCQPHSVVVDDHDGTFLGIRRESPLFAKLRTAAVSSGETGGSSASEKRTSSPVNVGAIDLSNSIRAKVTSWYTTELAQLGLGAPRDMKAIRLDQLTGRWVTLVINRYRAGDITDYGLKQRVDALHGVADSIRDLLDPNYSFELTSPCPSCLAVDAPGDLIRRALIVTEKAPLEDSFVTCRACGMRWSGIHEARLLSLELDQMREKAGA